MTEERSSAADVPPPFVLPSPEDIALLEAANGLRQFDRLSEMIDEGISGRFRLRPSQLQELNRIAVEGLTEAPGSYRPGSISISGSSHQPPPFERVPSLVEELCDHVNDHWETSTPNHLAAFVMWRLNWIHPFRDGNGRTSRAASYLVQCVKLGMKLPGSPTIPERIAENKFPYYDALDAADAAWKQGSLDLAQMEELLQSYLAAQLTTVLSLAAGRDVLAR